MLQKKMFRDIKDYKMQFISIFLMAFIGVFVFTGMYVETNSFETTINDYYNETNLADGWIYSNYLVDDALHQVYLLGATTQMERQLVVDSNAKLDNRPEVILHFVENNTISKFYPLEGSEVNTDDTGGVWLDKSFADAWNLKVGDEISFESNGIEIKKQIRGIGYSPEYVYDSPAGSTVPNHTAFGFAYLSHKAFPSSNITYNVLDVKFEGTPEMYAKLLDYRFNGYYTAFVSKSNQFSVDVVAESIAQQNAMSTVFPPIFIILSMMMLSTTMKRIISNQRTQIGVLKANGFSNNAISMHYVFPGFLFVTLSSILATFVGPIVFHMLANPSRTAYFKFPYWNSIGLTNSISLIILMAILSLLVSHYSIKSIVNESSSVILKPKVPKASVSSFVEKMKIWNALPFNFRWNYRNINRDKFKAVMTIVGVIGCTVLLISGLGLFEQLNESKEWYFDDVNHFESKLIVGDNLSLSQVASIANKVNGAPIMESSIEILGDKTEVGLLLVMDKTDLITMTDDNRNQVNIDKDEVSISKKLADNLHVSVGDTIQCHAAGSDKIVNITIDKIHSSPYSQGLVMSPSKLQDLGLNYTPTGVVSAQHVEGSYDGVTGIIYLNDLVAGWDELESTSMMIITVLIFFAVVLALVIVYNLNVLSFTEMENELASLKVLGFKSFHLTKLLATQGFSLIIFGFLIGIPVGYSVLAWIIPAFGEDFYLIPSISITNLAITFVVIISVSVVMNIFFSRKIKRLDMVNSLKNYE
ncbi:MAG: FtsX-like permease family protein [Methanobrevibacter millerae]|uniref:FtsX-like permease family protein n=1 Tax=Methanobrevibacter millerae TaxID=230361 RepID=A0A8T3VTW0_9EURY|nr:FtsX-like permease family protein [Methanobrevibacter millerae]